LDYKKKLLFRIGIFITNPNMPALKKSAGSTLDADRQMEFKFSSKIFHFEDGSSKSTWNGN
jgi:hypothetical protein